MAVVVEEDSGNSILALAPTAELLTADVIHEIETHCSAHPATQIIVDLRAVHFLVSGSLYPEAAPFRPLIRLHQRLQQEGRRLVLCNLSREVSDVFRITRLEKIFEIQPDLDTARSSVDGRPG